MKKEILNQLRLEKIEVDEKACKNFANRQLVCNDCGQVCPTNAIQMVKNIPVIDQGKCIDCGVCISQCTVSAIDHIQNPYLEISNAIDAHPAANITCKQLEEYQKGIKIPCYLYLDLPLLIKSRRNEVTIFLAPCDRCEKNEVVDVVLHIQNLQQQLEQLNIPVKLKIEKEKLILDEDPIVKGISRRELLKMFSIKSLRDIILEKDDEESIDTNILSGKDKVLFKRKVINNYFFQNENGRHKKISLPFDQFLKIDAIDHCRGCDICQKICPTNAIQWIQYQNHAELEFDTQACIACKKCSMCPDQAIHFQPINHEEYLTTPKRTLITLHLKQCNECGETFRTKLDVEICEFCEANKQKDSSRFFV